MTGRYPHNSGALGFTKINPGVPTLPETLLKNGFMTGILGKTEHVVPSRPKAFGYRRDRSEMANGRSQELYGQFTAEFLGQVKKADKPFFLMVNAHDPHRPFDNRKPASERKFADQAEEASKNKRRESAVIIRLLRESFSLMKSSSPGSFPTCLRFVKRSPSTTVP